MKLMNLIPAKYHILAIVLTTLLVVGGIAGYLAWRDNDVADKAVKTERVTVENKTLKDEKASVETDIITRKKQNEILTTDMPPAVIDGLYERGAF